MGNVIAADLFDFQSEIVESRLKRLKKTANRFGEDVTWAWGEPKKVPARNQFGRALFGQFWTVYPLEAHCTADSSIGNGGRLVAAIDLLDGGVVLRTLGEELPQSVRDSIDLHQCDHCGHRRHRVKSYIVQDAQGEYLQVGSTCMKEYAGHNADLRALLCFDFNEVAGGDEDFMGGGGSRDVAYDTVDWLTVCVGHVRDYGYTSRAKAEAHGVLTTAEAVRHLLTAIAWSPCPDERKAAREKVAHYRDQYTRNAESIIEWASELAATNEYLANVKAVVCSDTVEGKHLGIAASAVTAYERDKGKHEENKAAAAKSSHIGEVKQRMTVSEVAVTGRHTFVNDFGATTIYSMVDAVGNVLKWFSSRTVDALEAAYDSKATVTLVGTVKAHSEYQGVAETILTRCKIK